MRRIATHREPDANAIAAAWLAEAYLFAGEDVVVAFVPRRRRGSTGPRGRACDGMGVAGDQGASAGLRTPIGPRWRTCVSIIVVRTSAWLRCPFTVVVPPLPGMYNRAP